MSDPYQPSRSGVGLYSVQGIVIGTVLGSLAAGIVMLVLNYRALGKSDLARAIAIWGSLLCLVVVVLTSFTPGTPPFALMFTVLQGTLAYFLAARLQGPAIAWHRARNGLVHSSLRAAGVGLLTAMAILFILTIGVILFGDLPPPAVQPPESGA